MQAKALAEFTRFQSMILRDSEDDHVHLDNTSHQETLQNYSYGYEKLTYFTQAKAGGSPVKTVAHQAILPRNGSPLLRAFYDLLYKTDWVMQ